MASTRTSPARPSPASFGTGTDPVGVQRWGLELGPQNPPFDVGVGLSGIANSSWITSGTDKFNRFYHMYAISEVLTAVPVPEPSSLIVIGMGAAIFFARRNRRQD